MKKNDIINKLKSIGIAQSRLQELEPYYLSLTEMELIDILCREVVILKNKTVHMQLDKKYQRIDWERPTFNNYYKRSPVSQLYIKIDFTINKILNIVK